MEKLKKIYAAILDFCTNKMRLDGALHLIACCVIATILKLFLPICLVIAVTFLVIALKEFWWDYKHKQGTVETRDVYWGLVGLVIGLL